MSGLSRPDAGRPEAGPPEWPKGWIEFRKERNRPVVVENFTGQLAGTARTGVLFPSGRHRLALIVCLVAGLVCLAEAILFLWFVVARHHYSAVGNVLSTLVWAAFFITGAVCYRRLSRRVPRGLVLTPDAVCGPDGKSVLPWDVIAEIRCTVVRFSWRWSLLYWKTLRRPLSIQANYLLVSVTGTDRVEGLHPWLRRLSRRLSQPVILRLATRLFAGNPAAVFHALRHYQAHPEDRAELGNGAALARILGERS